MYNEWSRSMTTHVGDGAPDVGFRQLSAGSHYMVYPLLAVVADCPALPGDNEGEVVDVAEQDPGRVG